jgi:hypothetical protein
MVLHDIDVNMKTEDLFHLIMQTIQKETKYKTHVSKKYDTLKLYMKAHSFKSQQLVINFEDDDVKIFHDGKTLGEQGVEDETELSCFVFEEYKNYKQHPEMKWVDVK